MRTRLVCNLLSCTDNYIISDSQESICRVLDTGQPSQESTISFCPFVLMIDRSSCVVRAERVYTLLVLGSCGLLHGFSSDLLRSCEYLTASVVG